MFNNYNFKNLKKINFKNYKYKLVIFIWWFYLNDEIF